MTEEPRSLRGKLPWLALAALLLATDLWSKDEVFALLREGEQRNVLGSWLSLAKVRNTGMMWGALQGYAEVLRWLRVGAALVVVAMMASTPARSRLLQLALALVLGGAVGNIYDGFQFGHVRDFILVDLDVAFFDPFPVFNVADSAICVGVALLALGLLLQDREQLGATEGKSAQ